jgi:hypothetical protein
MFLIIVLFFVAPLLGLSILEGGSDGKSLSTLLGVGQSCRIFVRKLACTAGFEALATTLLKIQHF